MKEIIKNKVIYAKVLEIAKNTYAIYLKDKELETLDCIKYTLENRQETINLLKNNKNKLINTILNQITISLIALSLFSLLTGCGGKKNADLEVTPENDKTLVDLYIPCEASQFGKIDAIITIDDS